MPPFAHPRDNMSICQYAHYPVCLYVFVAISMLKWMNAALESDIVNKNGGIFRPFMRPSVRPFKSTCERGGYHEPIINAPLIKDVKR